MTKNRLESKRLAYKTDKAEKASGGNDRRGGLTDVVGECNRNAAHIASSRGGRNGRGADAAFSEEIIKRHGLSS